MPPVAVTLAVPVGPAQPDGVVEVVSTIKGGCVITTVSEAVHPEESLTVMVYTPAISPVAVGVVPPEGVHV